MEVHERITNARKAAGMSLTDLSRQSGVSRGYLYQLERGENSPTIEVVQKLAAALNVSAASFVIENANAAAIKVTRDERRLIEFYRAGDYASALRVIAGKMDRR